MRAVFTFLLVFLFLVLKAQIPCDLLDEFSASSLVDEPPGCIICRGVGKVNNKGATPDTTLYESCLVEENSIWMNFFAEVSGDLFIRFVTSNCETGEGIEMAIYDEELTCLGVFDNSDLVIGDLAVYGVTYGEKFLLQMDGVNGDVCDVFISISRSPDSSGPPPPSLLIPEHENVICEGDTVCYEIRNLNTSTYFQWEIDSIREKVVDGGGIDDSWICVLHREIGLSEIKVLPFNGCSSNLPLTSEVTVGNENIGSIYSISNTNEVVCRGDEIEYFLDTDAHVFDWSFPVFLELTDGAQLTDTFANFKVIWPGVDSVVVSPLNCLDESGQTVAALVSSPTLTSYFETIIYCEGEPVPTPRDTCYSINAPCDSCVFYQVLPPLPRRFNFLDTFICKNGCVMIDGVCYDRDTVFVFESGAANECDSTFSLNITEIAIFPSANINYFRGNDGVNVRWDKVPLADYYVVTIDRDSVFQTTDNLAVIPYSFGNHTFDVKVQPFGDCEFLPSEITVFGNSETNKIDFSNKIKIYPNPTKGKLFIESERPIEGVELFNFTGKFLRKEITSEIDINDYQSGIYILKIFTSEGVAIKKFIKN